MNRTRPRLLTIAHSYCVDVNRRLAHELASTGEWDVTAVGPARFRGDFSWHTTEASDGECCTVVPVPVRFGRRVHTMIYGSALAQLLKEPWDLVHCWEEPYVASAAQVARFTRRDTPLVFSTYQNIAKQYPPPFSWIERYAMSRAAGMIVGGKTILDVAAPRMRADTPVRTITLGVDTAAFVSNPEARDRIRHTLHWTDESPVVGFLGRFVPEKGCRVLMHALDGLEKMGRPWHALFVGGGPLEHDLRRWSERYGHRVAIATGIGHASVPQYLNAMDVLCAPSETTQTWREQFGRMIIEAFSCGLPVVASDSGEIPHVVDDAGLILPEGDVNAWRDALDALLAAPARLASMSSKGRARAVERFGWSVIAHQHLNFFEEVVQSRTTRPPRTVVRVDERRTRRSTVKPERVA